MVATAAGPTGLRVTFLVELGSGTDLAAAPTHLLLLLARTVRKLAFHSRQRNAC